MEDLSNVYLILVAVKRGERVKMDGFSIHLLFAQTHFSSILQASFGTHLGIVFMKEMCVCMCVCGEESELSPMPLIGEAIASSSSTGEVNSHHLSLGRLCLCSTLPSKSFRPI